MRFISAILLLIPLTAQAAVTQLNVLSFGARGNGVTDDTQAIQNALNAASGSNELYFPGGVYPVSSTLTINSANGLRIVAPPASLTGGWSARGGAWLLHTGSSTNAMLRILDGSAIEIHGLGFRGNTNGIALAIDTSVQGALEKHGLFEHLFFYQCLLAIAINKENGGSKQSDFNRFEQCRGEELGQGFAFLGSANTTCTYFDTCTSSLNNSGNGTYHYQFNSCDIVKLHNCAGAYGQRFAWVNVIGNDISLDQCQWEASTHPAPRFLYTDSPGFGNATPITLRNCNITDPIELSCPSRIINLAGGNSIRSSILLSTTDNTIYDLGNYWRTVYLIDSYPYNQSFDHDLAGWSVGANWAWGSFGGNGVAAHSPGATNALRLVSFPAMTNALYKVIVTRRMHADGSLPGGTNGTFGVYLDSALITTLNPFNYTYISDTFQTTNQTSLTLSIVPSIDCDGAVDDVSIQWSPMQTIPLAGAQNNYFISVDGLRGTSKRVYFVGTNGVINTDSLFNYDPSPTARWLQLGDYSGTQSDTGTKLSLNSGVRQQATLYVGDYSGGRVTAHQISGAFITMGAVGEEADIVLGNGGPLRFVTQSGTDMGTWNGRTYQTSMDAQGRWAFGFGGNNPPTNALVSINGGLSLSGLTNLIADNGTTLTYNGIAIGGGGSGNVSFSNFDSTYFSTNASTISLLSNLTNWFKLSTNTFISTNIDVLSVGTLNIVTNFSLTNITASRVAILDASKNLTNAGVGADGQVLTWDSGSVGHVLWTNSTITATNVHFSVPFPIQSTKLVTARIDAAENNWRLLFTPASNQTAICQFALPDNYVSGGTFKINWSAASATSGNAVWSAEVMAVSPGSSADVNVDSYDTPNTVTTATPGTAGFMTVSSITLSNNDSWKAGDLVKIRVSCTSSSTLNSGDAEALTLVFNYVGQ